MQLFRFNPFLTALIEEQKYMLGFDKNCITSSIFSQMNAPFVFYQEKFLLIAIVQEYIWEEPCCQVTRECRIPAEFPH